MKKAVKNRSSRGISKSGSPEEFKQAQAIIDEAEGDFAPVAELAQVAAASSGNSADPEDSMEAVTAESDSDQPADGGFSRGDPAAEDGGPGGENSDAETESDQAPEGGPAVPLQAALSALLFVSSRPLTIDTLARAARASADEVADALSGLKETLTSEQFGFILIEVAGAYQFRTAPALAVTVKRLVRQRDRRLSRAAAETLAVIAYKQPVGRAEIEAIRGVDALPTLKTLLDAKLVRIVGRDNTVGHPALFGTTERFLERFGLSDLSELMSMKEIDQLMRDPGETGDNDSEDIIEADGQSAAAAEDSAEAGETASDDALDEALKQYSETGSDAR